MRRTSRKKSKTPAVQLSITPIKIYIYDVEHYGKVTAYLTEKFGSDWRYVQNTINDHHIRQGIRSHATVIVDSVIEDAVANDVRDFARRTTRMSIDFRDESHFYYVTKWLNRNHGRSKLYWTINMPNVSRLRQGKPVKRTIQLFGYDGDIEELRLFLMLG